VRGHVNGKKTRAGRPKMAVESDGGVVDHVLKGGVKGIDDILRGSGEENEQRLLKGDLIS